MSIRYLVVLLPLLLVASHASAGNEDLRSVVDEAATVDEAVARIIEVVEGQGYEISLVVNHAAAADSIGQFLRPTQVIFARPPRFLERRVLRRGATVGIDLPVKFLVFEDEQGDIQLRTNGIGYLIDRHGLVVTDFDLWLLRAVTRQFGDSEDGLVTIRSYQTVDETVAALETAIASNAAFRIPLVLDYGASRKSRQSLIVFGNPNAGTPLMQATQEVALDLPQKFLVWQGHGRDVFISYNDPAFVARRHDVEGQDARLDAIAAALAGFAKAGAGTPPQ